MANSFTVSKETVFGDTRILFGTLVCGDGEGTAIATGLNYVYWMGLTSSQMARATCNHTTNGSVQVCTAGSGASYSVMIVGY